MTVAADPRKGVTVSHLRELAITLFSGQSRFWVAFSPTHVPENRPYSALAHYATLQRLGIQVWLAVALTRLQASRSYGFRGYLEATPLAGVGIQIKVNRILKLRAIFKL